MQVLFLSQKQNPLCWEPHFVKDGRSCISIPNVWIRMKLLLRKFGNNGLMIKTSVAKVICKTVSLTPRWTMRTTFKIEAAESNRILLAETNFATSLCLIVWIIQLTKHWLCLIYCSQFDRLTGSYRTNWKSPVEESNYIYSNPTYTFAIFFSPIVPHF